MIFSHEEFHRLIQKRDKLDSKWIDVQGSCLKCRVINIQAKEYQEHGFLRRLGTIVRCIQNVFTICPIDRDKKLSREEEIDLRIQLQSHVSNVFGCLDNIAWIWIYEKNITEKGKSISRHQVGLAEKCKSVRATPPIGVLKYLEDQKAWLDGLEELRHALAHRIPLYVPPYILTRTEAENWKALDAQIWTALGENQLDAAELYESQKSALGNFCPVMKHSFGEQAPLIFFHSQMLLDFEIITELADKLSSSF